MCASLPDGRCQAFATDKLREPLFPGAEREEGVMSKSATVDLIGVARIVAGRKEIFLTLTDDATWRDAIAALARAAPGLVGEVIATDRRKLVGNYAFNLGGRTFVQDLDEEMQPPQDDSLTLMDFSDI